MKTSKIASILIATIAAIACFPSFASAQAPATAAPVCPARYEPMHGLCYNKASGDMVQAATAVSTPALTDANCRAGYTILLETMCYSKVTGDIELPNTAPRIVVQAPGKTN